MTNTRSLLEKAAWIAGIVSAVGTVVALMVSSNSNQQTEIHQSAGSNSTQIGNVSGTVILNQKSKEQQIPSIRDEQYSIARALLIRGGWIPQTNHWAHGDTIDIQTGNGSYFWSKGYHELDYCSGTGYALCRFEFNDPKGNLLVVITAGEVSDNDNNVKVFRVYLNPSNEEGAYGEILGASQISIEDMRKTLQEAKDAHKNE